MKRSLAFTLFYVCTPILMLARTVQRFYMIDSNTGFYRNGFEIAGTVVTAACLVFALVLVLLVRLSGPKEIKLPEKSKSISYAGIFAAVCLVISSIESLITGSGFANTLMCLLALAFAVTLVWYSLAAAGKTEFPAAASLVGVVYAITRLFVNFTGYTGEIAVSDSTFDIVTMCLTLLFLTAMAKQICSIRTAKVSAAMYGFGLAAVTFCLCAFFPCLIAIITGNSANIHGGSLPDASHIGLAVFIFAVLNAIDDSESEDSAQGSAEEKQ